MTSNGFILYSKPLFKPFLGLVLILLAAAPLSSQANYPHPPCFQLLQSPSPDELVERVQELGPIIAQIREVVEAPPSTINESPESLQAMEMVIRRLTHISEQIGLVIRQPKSKELFPLSYGDRKRIEKLQKKINDLTSLVQAHQNKLTNDGGVYGAHLDLSFGFKLLWDTRTSKILQF